MKYLILWCLLIIFSFYIGYASIVFWYGYTDAKNCEYVDGLGAGYWPYFAGGAFYKFIKGLA